jgi:NADH:ubiquinone oxidoreductase subunit F (NADH-binding)
MNVGQQPVRASAQASRILLTTPRPVHSLEEYRSLGGCAAYEKVLQSDPAQIIDVIRSAKLRGRGGAGFPTATKWEGVRASPAPLKFICCNAAEGEPGTFKDRYLLRRNPYQVIEGIAIATRVVGAERAYIGIKRAFDPEIARLRGALEEFRLETDIGTNMEVVEGPDEYLFGEEKALLEVIEGGLPLPRVFPPHLHGLFGATYAGPSDLDNNPTVVNNVETLAHVPHIIARGPGWFRSFGTEDTPGTMVFTISGDVQRPVVEELPLGMTLRQVIADVAGGLPAGRRVKAVYPGVANTVIAGDAQLDTSLGFDSMKAAGSGLGSAGFIVYDDSACMVHAAYNFSRFLYTESCDQCAPCKLGGRELTERLERLLLGRAQAEDCHAIEEIATWVTNGQRCYLATSESMVVSSTLRRFPDDFAAHLNGSCELRHDFSLPKMTDYVAGQGFTYDESYARKQPDWTYGPV